MTPVLYSFRRCPYAMRARLALLAAGQRVALREIVLRDKPKAFLDASPTGTVPCLVLPDQVPIDARPDIRPATVIDESLDIMIWALERSDPDGLMDLPHQQGRDWIARCDGPFKHALDRTKYATRYPDSDPARHRADAAAFLHALDAQIDRHIFARPSIADLAIAPFVRQFAFIDKHWFDAQPWPRLQGWLDRFLSGSDFVHVMQKFPPWHPGQPEVIFPAIEP